MKMQGKSSKKRKTGKIILLGMSFLLTVVMTFTITLAWFYDSDWASNSVTMAGTVGIEIRRKELDSDPEGANLTTSGSGQLYFDITTDLAYPGQAIDVSASVYNNGGKSVINGKSGSACYIRAHFAVYTNIGMDDPTTPDVDEALEESEMNAQSLYDFLVGLVETQNKVVGTSYYWQYHRNTGSMPISLSGTSTEDVKYFYEGTQYEPGTQPSTKDRGYFYLCYKQGTHQLDDNTTLSVAKDGVLMPLNVTKEAVFLWNDTFIIPWTLTNYSADKLIYVVVTFQAVQTFIPVISNAGVISGAANNQLPAMDCMYNNSSVQTVFNSCNFKSTAEEEATIKTAFGGEGKYSNISTPVSS